MDHCEGLAINYITRTTEAAEDKSDSPESGNDSETHSTQSVSSEEHENDDDKMAVDEDTPNITPESQRGDLEDGMAVDEDVLQPMLDDSKSGVRRSSRKRKTPPPAPSAGHQRKQPPAKKVKKELKREPLASSKSNRKLQEPDFRNYFEEVDVMGGSRLRDVYELIDLMACFLLLSISLG